MSVDIRPNPASSGAVTGGLVYKGSYNVTTNNPDLTTSTQGDFYIVNPDAGTLAGITLNVGDHIVFNQDASSPLTSAMFDVIDNTDAVVSVNGQTGPVVLGASDVSALAIANNLSDLNNAGTARTNLGVAIGSDVQAYDAQLADIAGLTPTDSNFIVGNGSNFVLESGATARASLSLGSASTEDVGTGANNVVQLDGSSRLPAVDGSQLTGVTGTDSTKLAIANNLSDLNNAGTARTNLGVAIGSDVQAYDAQLADIAGLTPTDSNFIVGNGSNFVLESGATARASLSLGSASTEDVGTSANNVVQLDGSSRLPAVDGSQLTNLPSSGGFSYTAITSASSPVTSSTGVHYGADSSGGAITFNLPALSGLSGGEEIRIKLNTAGNNLTITPNGSDTVEGAATYVMSIAKEAVTCVASSGTNWEII